MVLVELYVCNRVGLLVWRPSCCRHRNWRWTIHAELIQVGFALLKFFELCHLLLGWLREHVDNRFNLLGDLHLLTSGLILGVTRYLHLLLGDPLLLGSPNALVGQLEWCLWPVAGRAIVVHGVGFLAHRLLLICSTCHLLVDVEVRTRWQTAALYFRAEEGNERIWLRRGWLLTTTLVSPSHVLGDGADHFCGGGHRDVLFVSVLLLCVLFPFFI